MRLLGRNDHTVPTADRMIEMVNKVYWNAFSGRDMSWPKSFR